MTSCLSIVGKSEVSADVLVPLINRAYTRYEILKAPRISTEGFAIEWRPATHFLLVHEGDRLVACAMIANARDYFEQTAGESAIKPEALAGTDYAERHETARPMQPPFEGNLADALYFGLAAVEPGAQNGGHGRSLLSGAERLAREQRYRRVVLTTMREFGLVTYYVRAGYRVVGEERFPAGHWSVSVPHGYCFMEKAL